MNAIVIEHVPLADLPAAWRARLDPMTQTLVTVRIEAEIDTAQTTAPADDLLFGMWRDRQDMADVAGYIRSIRASRFGDPAEGGMRHPRLQARTNERGPALSMLIDSDVLVWLTRGHPLAAQRLNAIAVWRISAVTYMELAQGCRDKAELARLKKGLAARHTEILSITPAIAQCACDLIDALALSHGMRLADALIGATAIEHHLTLVTANVKHFSAVSNLALDAFAPG